MDEGMVQQVRRFNRTVTQRIGLLTDRFLARDRPLGEARLLWEIGEDGADVRELRARLELDSGYVSRLLRSLESAGLVQVASAPHDRRVRRARLTAAGVRERRIYDRRSDDLAASLLAPLPGKQRQELVEAMAKVERLLTASIVTIEPIDPEHPDARYCLGEYFAELGRRFESGFDAGQTLPAEPEEMRPPAGLFLVAHLRSEAVGCGGLKFHDDRPTEIKRLWVSEKVRGLGVGRRLLQELEEHAVRHAGGDCSVRLDTNRSLVEAIQMYRSSGYVEVPRFNDEPYAHHWFEKRLCAAPDVAVTR